ncbi:MAG: hypothetical protein NT155_03085 [Candidatus Staskawiczbacteria bacterium]|nr:hypothetical protein [Candidatus Staskawiczbacteria bacterium]
MDNQIQKYIEQARASGQKDEQIKQTLLQSGWNQAQINEAFGIPNPPSNVVSPPPPPPTRGQSFNPESLTKDPKLITTVKTFAIYAPVLSVVSFVVGVVTSGFRYSFYLGMFSVPALIMAIISGVIGGAIGGIIFFFIYDPVHSWVKRTPFLAKYIHNMFELFWIPSLVFSIIGGAFGLLGLLSLGAVSVGIMGGYGAVSVGGAFIGVIISLAANLVVYYFYAKMISAKLESMYPW